MSESSRIRVLIVKPEEKPYVEEIDCELESFQKIVGGDIEEVSLESDTKLVCNGEGKINGLTPNRLIGDDIICGTFFLAGYDGGEELVSLSDEKIEKYQEKLKEGFMFCDETADKNKQFISKLNRFLADNDFDFSALGESYETEDKQYAMDILRDLHRIFVDTYGTDCIDDIADGDEGFLYVPAIIKAIDTGKICIGLVYLDRHSSGEHWDTIYMTKHGIIDHMNPPLNQDAINEIKSYLPYHYWYTPEYAGDIHVNKRTMPQDIKEMLEYAVTEEQTPSMDMQM